ncbi:MAG: hypothetical protein H6774_01975 [Pseudomonadales bacterium]|nr:hypothetical protein [Pseudomonadales bacterium]
MKKLFLSALLGFCLMLTPSVYAQGMLNTPSDQTGDVVARKDGDILYLTTSVTDNSASGTTEQTSQTTTTTSSTQQDGDVVLNTYFGQIVIPQGYFHNFGELFTKLLTAAMAVAALLTLGFLIWGAFKWITSGGDKGKIDSARSTLIAAVVGLIIVAASYAILLLTLNFLGIEGGLNGLLQRAGSAMSN